MNGNEASANKTYNITTNGTVYLPLPANPAGKIVLIRIVNNKAGGTGNTAVIYDSNETLGVDSELKKGTLDTVNVLGSVEYGFPIFNGIYIVVGGGTAPDLTVVYKDTP